MGGITEVRGCKYDSGTCCMDSAVYGAALINDYNHIQQVQELFVLTLLLKNQGYLVDRTIRGSSMIAELVVLF